uniref:Fungal lipase-type domain-containing protein n=1 Tax=Helicotheca tamesis TaxID=374047 RepID=A0A7S2MW95_9STRA|mmetsp:Transcript_4654/g.6373  ORF Transcript_4654/g.6373 Transcript_4654/m.6373 type:complete len:267 (+) Transcript_4654:205-1005(+)
MTSTFHHLLIYLFLLAHVSFGKQQLLRQHLSHHSPQHKTIPKNNNKNDIHESFTIKTNTREKTADIPSLEYTIEFAQLSNLVYQYHTLDYTSCTSSSREVDKDAKSHGNSTYNKNDEDDDGGKDEIELPKNVTCEMYEHDKEEGTQVLIVTSTTKKYIAVIYAGTDDVQSTILDGAFLQKQFDPNIPNNDDGNILVHSGFHNAVFKDGIYLRVLNKVQELKTMHNGGKEEYDIVTSGHSLGAASSILTAVAFAHHFNNDDDDDDDV